MRPKRNGGWVDGGGTLHELVVFCRAVDEVPTRKNSIRQMVCKFRVNMQLHINKRGHLVSMVRPETLMSKFL